MGARVSGDGPSCSAPFTPLPVGHGAQAPTPHTRWKKAGGPHRHVNSHH